jgi:predicted PP-loop superfamily ATPase
MTRCARCVLPETFPGISFGDDGVCSICRAFAAREPSADSATRQRETLSRIVETSRVTAQRHDAVVAFSGGKDSTFLLYLLKKQFDLRLLAVTFDNGFLSDASFDNMRTVVAALGVDHVVVKYRQDHVNRIFLASALGRVYPDHLTKFGSGTCISCIRMVMTAALRTAVEERIPMVMLGNSPGQVLRSDDELIYRDNRIPFALRRQLFARVAERTGPWVYDYLMLTAAEYATNPFPYFISPLPIVGYDEAEIFRTIATLGWSRPRDVDPHSTNCRLNAFGIVRHQNLYRFHPYDYEMSQLVRLGSMSRDAALEKLEDRAGRVMGVATRVERDLFCGSCDRDCRSC